MQPWRCPSAIYHLHRDFLPSGKLEHGWVLCAADPGPAGEIVHLPWTVGEQQAAMLARDPTAR
jgi:hypothetical protein